MSSLQVNKHSRAAESGACHMSYRPPALEGRPNETGHFVTTQRSQSSLTCFMHEVV